MDNQCPNVGELLLYDKHATPAFSKTVQNKVQWADRDEETPKRKKER